MSSFGIFTDITNLVWEADLLLDLKNQGCCVGLPLLEGQSPVRLNIISPQKF